MNSYCIGRGTSKVLASSKSKRNLKGCMWWTRQCLSKDLHIWTPDTGMFYGQEGRVFCGYWRHLEKVLSCIITQILSTWTHKVDRSSGGKGGPDASLDPGSQIGGWRWEQMFLQSSKDTVLLADTIQWDSLLCPQHCEKIVFYLW